MPPRRKRSTLKEWLSSFFTSKNQIRDGSGGFFENAERFTVNDPTIMSVRGDQNTVINIQGDRTTVTQVMSLLSQHIIRGAAHDDSARTPPPRCHPQTRVKLIARITSWYEGQAQSELLLWITGPAGVGKSAIVQTFAEYLAESKSLGASIFISRPNKRNDPHGIFISIAYQLATRIEAYREFIAERLSLDPSLLNKDMKAQFSTFIVEPFVEKKIAAGGKRWGILLDGLDELRGEDAQCSIIELISTFVQEHPDTPLAWIIASRPESHISNTFDDDDVRRNYWTEYVPVDSTEACADVERFLRSTFKTTQKKYRQSVPSDWPSDTDFLKLTAAASGLFVYAEVVMQFIRDSKYADPAARFEVVLSVISRSNVVPTKENPFVQLDALYHEILSSIPSAHWVAAKQLLGFTIHEEHLNVSLFPADQLIFGTLKGMSILFSLRRNTVYACLTKCRSALKIPEWKSTHKEKLTFFHASFADYLKDSSRSRNFHVGDYADVEGVVLSNLMEIWCKCTGDDVATALVESTWHKYCSELDGKTLSRAVAKFHAAFFCGLVRCLGRVIVVSPSGRSEFFIYARRRKVHMIKLCYCLDPPHLCRLVSDMTTAAWGTNQLAGRVTQMRDLKFGHLDWKGMSPASMYYGRLGRFSNKSSLILNRPRSSAELRAFLSELEDIQRQSPDHIVYISGGIPSGRVAFFRVQSGDDMYYVIPYPE